MKKFKFNLEALLRMYLRDEEEKKKRLGEANRALSLAEQELVRLGEEYDGCQRSEALIREKGVSVHHLRLYVQYIFDLKVRIEKQNGLVRECMRQVRLCREKLIESKRKVKSTELIKAKRKEAWRKERNTFEMKQLDDICQQQYIRSHPQEVAVG